MAQIKNERIEFVRIRKPGYGRSTTVIRIKSEVAQELQNISYETGLSVADIASDLINFAMEHVEMIDPK